MDSSDAKPEIAEDLSPFILIYKNGTVERLFENEILPPSLDPVTNIVSKDTLYSPEHDLFVRLYIPAKISNETHHQKLPILVYFHGGGFCCATAFSPTYHNYLNSLVSKANVIAVSVDYRRAPENPVPCAHNDSWAALKWIGSHVNGSGPEDWLNLFADFNKVFLAGDSAGANIAHHMGIKHGEDGENHGLGFDIEGIILFHPYFWGNEPVGGETKDLEERGFMERLWKAMRPTTSGCDDPWINPVADGEIKRLARLGCRRVVVFVAEKDLVSKRGLYYGEKLKESGWKGDVEIVENKGEVHVFFLFNPTSENAVALLNKVASFIRCQNEYRNSTMLFG